MRREGRSTAARAVLRGEGRRAGWPASGLVVVAMLGFGWGGGSSASAEEAGVVGSGFLAQVAAHFERWDLDRDGALSFRETSRLVPDVTIRDEAAAALAAIHLAQRGDRWSRQAFGRDVLAGSPDASEPGRRPPFETYHRVGLAHIRATDRRLFVGDGPDLKRTHQGALGDCYFIATLGALIQRDPSEVARIVRPGASGSFEVRFPDGEPVQVWHVSDAEIALGSFAGGEGLWLNVLEKAYGKLLERSLSRRGIFEDAIDALGQGGHGPEALTLFTGCDASILRFRPEDPQQRPGERRVAGFLPRTRNQLVANFRDRRLTTCGTTDAEMPPGIAKTHLYAVLGFDPAADVVHLWNPWGIDFEPDGPPGLLSGYPTRRGHFSVPLADFIRIFDSLFSETDRQASLW
jgi:Calpain family cysteine protease